MSESMLPAGGAPRRIGRPLRLAPGPSAAPWPGRRLRLPGALALARRADALPPAALTAAPAPCPRSRQAAATGAGAAWAQHPVWRALAAQLRRRPETLRVWTADRLPGPALRRWARIWRWVQAWPEDRQPPSPTLPQLGRRLQRLAGGAPAWKRLQDRALPAEVPARPHPGGAEAAPAGAAEPAPAEPAGPAPVRDRWPDAPAAAAGLLLPAGYVVDAAGVRIADDHPEESPRELATGPILLTRKGRDADTGEAWSRCWYRDATDRQDRQRWLPDRLAFGGRAAGAGLRAIGLPVLPGAEADLGRFLARMERDAAAQVLPPAVLVRRTGWVRLPRPAAMDPDPDAAALQAQLWPDAPPPDPAPERWAFAWPRDPDGADGDGGGEVECTADPYELRAYRPWGDAAAEVETLRWWLDRYPPLAWLAGHAAAAPLVRWLAGAGALDVNGYAVETASDLTGVGKTLSLRVALLPWARPDLSVRPYWATTLGAARFLLSRSDLPVGLQEAQAQDGGRGGDWAAAVAPLIHALADGGGKLQGQADGGLRAEGLTPLYGVLLLANNQSIVGDDAQQGAAARVLSAGALLPTIAPGTPDWDAFRAAERALYRGAGHLGRDLVALWTAQQRHEGLANWRQALVEAHQTLLDWLERQLPRDLPDLLRRQLKLEAAGLLGLLQLAHRAGWPDAFQQRLREAGALAVIHERAGHIAQDRAPEWRRALELFASWLRQQRALAGGAAAPAPDGAAPDAAGVWTDSGGRVLAFETTIGGGLPVLAVEPALLRQWAERTAWARHLRGLQQAWVREKRLIADPPHLTWLFRRDGRRQRLLAFRLEALAGEVDGPAPDVQAPR